MTGAAEVVVVRMGIVDSETVVTLADPESELRDVTTARIPLTIETTSSDHWSRPRRNITRMLDRLASEDAADSCAIESCDEPTRKISNHGKDDVPHEQTPWVPQREQG